MSRRPIVVTIVIVLAIALSTIGYIYISLPRRTEEQTLRIGLSTDISTIDIHFARGVADFEVLGKVYEALFKIDTDESGGIVYKPWLIRYWQQINSTTYLFVLKDNIKFHNGKPLDAWDVKASIERAVKGYIGSILLKDANGTPIIDRIEVLNTTTFMIILRKPFAFLLEHLAHLSISIMPREIAEKYMNEPIGNISDVVGTGPYRFVSYEPGSSIVLKVFDDYWGGKPKISTVVYKVLKDSTARLAALFNNEIDIAVGLSPDNAKDVVSRGFRIVNVSGTRLVIIAINNDRIPDPRVRMAMNYAIDREAIVKNIFSGYAKVAQWVIPPLSPDVVVMNPYSYDPEKARKLLEEAGFRLNRTLTLLVSTRSAKDITVAEAVQSYLRDIGIDVKIVAMDHNTFLDMVFNKHDFDLALYGPSPSSVYYGLSYWRTGSSLNGPNYSNPEYDELLDKAALESNATVRAELLREAQEILWRDCPAIWLYLEDFIYGVNPRVQGLRFVLGYTQLYNVYIGS